MNLTTFYTTVGRLEQRTDGQGRRYPVVIRRNKEYVLDLQEMIIWNSLNWRIAQMEEIGTLYISTTENFSYISDRSWYDCVKRLTVRGLLADGIGDTEYDALYNLLSTLYIIPANMTLRQRAATLLKLVLLGHISLSAAKRIFRKDKRTGYEQTIMELSGQALLSTAEIIKCAEMGIRQLPDENSILDGVYSDPYTTSDNIHFLVRCSPLNRPITLTVASLYLRRQIIFDQI